MKYWFFCWLFFSASAGSCELAELSNMLGTWTVEKGGKLYVEQWRSVSDSTFEGESQVINSETKEIVSYESMRIVDMSDRLYYIAKVAHNSLPIVFTADHCSTERVDFINPKHDFPNLIRYRVFENTLLAEVIDQSGEGFTIEFEATDPLLEETSVGEKATVGEER